MKKNWIIAIITVAVVASAVSMAIFFNRGNSSEPMILGSGDMEIYADSMLYGENSYVARNSYELMRCADDDSDYMEEKEVWCMVDGLATRRILLESDQRMIDVLFNMSMSELDSILASDHERVSRMFAAMSTRELSYAVYAALGLVAPDLSMELLRGRIKDGIIDRGLGGDEVWPVYSDGIIWAVAAWEVYKMTGNREWLSEAYEVVKGTLSADEFTGWNDSYGMMHGGSGSYVSRGYMAYPRWMSAKDVYETLGLANNVSYSAAYSALSGMAEALGHDGAESSRKAKSMARSINDYLWIPNLGYYSEYLYGGVYPIQSQATDNLGQAMSIELGVATADMARSVVSKSPLLESGIPPVYPMLNDVKGVEYEHECSFLPSWWVIAASKAHNADVMEYVMALTACEYLKDVDWLNDGKSGADDKRLKHCINSVTAPLRAVFGIRSNADGLAITPVVQSSLPGVKKMLNLPYRNMLLDISVSGTGASIESFSIDGAPADTCMVPADLTGRHRVEIVMTDESLESSKINLTEMVKLPETPVLEWENAQNVRIVNFVEGMEYGICLNSVFEEEIPTSSYRLYDAQCYTVVNVVPVADDRWIGYSAQPRGFIPKGQARKFKARDVTGGGTALIANRRQAAGFVELTVDYNRRVTFGIDCDEDGTYFLDLCYSNGNGSMDRQYKCSLRTLVVNGDVAGVFVMPQRGVDWWTSTAYSNMLVANLKKGRNIVSVEYRSPYNRNADVKVNTALIKYLRVIKK